MAAKIDTAKIKRTLLAMKQREEPTLEQLALRQRAQIAHRRRALSKKLEPLFGKVLPLEKINKLLARDNAELKKLLKKRSPETAKAFAAADDGLQRGLANRRKALELLATPGPTFKPPTYITLDPFLIWAQPSDILVDSHIEHLNSWAKVYYDRTSDSWDPITNTLTFYYAWENPSALYTVVNAQCSLILSGNCQAEGNTGITPLGYPFGAGDAFLGGDAALQPYEWWNQPPTISYPVARKNHFLNLWAVGSTILSGVVPGNIAGGNIFEGIDLRYELF